MTFPPGTVFGPYEVLCRIGAGGMGEVYKARDSNLDRLVAIKILPPGYAATADQLARFETEAKAVAALNHPNVMGIYDFGKEGDQQYAVMEFLEGETLRERLRAGPLAPKKAMDYAQQVAEGLGAAHAKGIIHRDVKPENIFITREGRVKVLDFGLAKQLPSWAGGMGFTGLSPSSQSGQEAVERTTEVGVVMGTVGYMAPEQVKAEPADHRTDIFALGLVLYEMVTGRQPFLKATSAQTLTACLEDEPSGLSGSRGQVPLGLEQLVLRCLEKEPANRFQCMRDLAYDLRNLASPGAGTEALRPGRRTRWPWLAAGLAAALIPGLILWALGYLGRPVQPPTFQRLTFVPGTIDAARFGPDGRTIYFSERVAGGQPELFVINPGAREPRALGLKDALLLGVSATSELAFLRHSEPVIEGLYKGLLARAPGEGGGGLREVREDVAEAAWDGGGLATLTLGSDLRFQLEFPAGKVVRSGKLSSEILHTIRLAPDGRHLAVIDGDTHAKAEIAVFDREGRRRVLFTKEGDSSGGTLTGLAWGPGGELWISEVQGDQTALWALGMGGGHRSLWQCAGACQLLDVSREGHALLAQHQARYGVLVQKAGELQPRDLSILGGTQAMGLTDDGRTLLLLESPSMLGGTARDEAYLRPLAGGPPLRLGRGNPQTLSSDGRWVQMDAGTVAFNDLDPAWITAFQEAGLEAAGVADPQARSRFVLFVPTALARPFAVALPRDCLNLGNAYLLPDGQRVVANIDLRGQLVWVVLDRRGAEPRVITEPGFGLYLIGTVPLAPDGGSLIVTGDGKAWYTQSLAGGAPRAIEGVLPGEIVLGWSADGRAVFVRSSWSNLPVTITRLELATGARRRVLASMPPDPAGHLVTLGVFLNPSAGAFAFTYGKKLSELYLVRGLP